MVRSKQEQLTKWSPRDESHLAILVGSGGRDRTADLGVMKPATEQRACFVVTTFTNVYRGSQLIIFAPVYAYYCLFPFKTDTVFPTVSTHSPTRVSTSLREGTTVLSPRPKIRNRKGAPIMDRHAPDRWTFRNGQLC
jgi:hypothetical protein